ncbi:hypothetical protein EDC04DRAFT_2898672 [Pisolithus marmoratus]|nr:hypothetical protein EDC04DRAFT_2898672 [Pisolithus marmoratus]
MQVTACVHILRSTYLPAYSPLIRPPYSSDPFPTTSSAPLDTVQRETRVLDTFIAIKTREDLFTDASGFHLGRHELSTALSDAAVLRTSSATVACAKASYTSLPPVQSALAPPHPSTA